MMKRLTHNFTGVSTVRLFKCFPLVVVLPMLLAERNLMRFDLLRCCNYWFKSFILDSPFRQNCSWFFVVFNIASISIQCLYAISSLRNVLLSLLFHLRSVESRSPSRVSTIPACKLHSCVLRIVIMCRERNWSEKNRVETSWAQKSRWNFDWKKSTSSITASELHRKQQSPHVNACKSFCLLAAFAHLSPG